MALPKFITYAALPLAPLFFASNMLFGKAIITGVEPWTLAFVRWGVVFLILFPFAAKSFWQHKRRVASLFSMFSAVSYTHLTLPTKA